MLRQLGATAPIKRSDHSGDHGQLLLLAAIIMVSSLLIMASVIVSYGSIGVLSSHESTHQLSGHYHEVREKFSLVLILNIEELNVDPSILPIEIVHEAFNETVTSFTLLESNRGVAFSAALLDYQSSAGFVIAVKVFLQIDDGRTAIHESFWLTLS